MNERLLQFIWQFQYYNKNELCTLQGERVQVVSPGRYNVNQGPDFTEAKVRVGETTWAGNIELHLHASDWFKHAHHTDVNYKNTILHVVWKNDLPENNALMAQIPSIELEPRISNHLIQRFSEMMYNLHFVPCEKSLHKVNPLVWLNWKDRLLAERLERKANYMLRLLAQSNHHWEETFWWLIARNFGIRVNADAFESVARTLPVNILARHKNQIHELEALLFGQAGLLHGRFEEAYPVLLQKEYRFYQKKYRLSGVFVALQFLRMRPAAFPSVRMAQLAVLIHQSEHVFSTIKEMTALREVKSLLNVTANDYWHYHYRFDEPGVFKPKNLGDDMVNNLCINTIIPVLFAYGIYRNEQAYKHKALHWLEELAAEDNRITRGWIHAGIANRHAFDSQSLIELKTMYCDGKRCLECMIGNALLKNSGDS